MAAFSPYLTEGVRYDGQAGAGTARRPSERTRMPTHTTGHISYAGWKESPAGPQEPLPRLAHASVTNAFTGGIEAAGTTCEYTIVYTTGKTGTFTGMELLAGRLDG